MGRGRSPARLDQRASQRSRAHPQAMLEMGKGMFFVTPLSLGINKAALGRIPRIQNLAESV